MLFSKLNYSKGESSLYNHQKSIFAAQDSPLNDEPEDNYDWIKLAGAFEGDIILSDLEQLNQLNQVSNDITLLPQEITLIDLKIDLLFVKYESVSAIQNHNSYFFIHNDRVQLFKIMQ